MYAWLADRIVQWRRWILAAIVVLAAVFATTAPDVGFDFTPQQMFQSTSSANQYRDTFAHRYGREDNLVAIAVSGGDIFAPETLEVIGEATFALRRLECIKNAESVATFEIPRTGESAGTMTVEPILSARQITSQQAVSPESAARLAKTALAEPLVRGRLVSRQGDAALVVAWIRDDLQKASELDDAVDRVQGVLEDHPLPEGYTYRLGGIPTLRSEIVTQLRTEQLTFLPITAGIFILLLGWLFRRPAGVILPVLTVSLAVLATVATLVWTHSPINIVNNVLPSLIFVIGISDSIHMLSRDAEEMSAGRDRLEAVKSTIRHTGVACLLTSCTTAVGFVSLLAADTDILQDFGWQAAAGVMFAYVATMLCLPAGLSYFKPVRRRTARGPDEASTGHTVEHLLMRCGRFIVDHCKVMVAASLCAAMAFGGLAAQVDIDTTLLEVFEHDHPSYKTTELIEQKLGGFLPVEISLESSRKDRFKDPDVYAKIATFQAFAQRQPAVLSTQSLVDFHQSARAALLGDPAERQNMPQSRAEIDQLQLIMAGAPDDPSGVNQFVTSDFRNTRILLRVSDVGAQAQMKLAGHLREKLDELFGQTPAVNYRITGDAYVASVALDSFIRDLFYSLLVALVIIFAMMAMVFKSVKLGLISMLPNIIPLVMTFGYMGLAGVNLNTTTIIIFAISLGLAVDDTIHFLARFREESGRRSTVKEAIIRTYRGAGRAILTTSALLVCGLAVLTVSNFIPTRQFGILTSITIAGAILGDLVLLPSLLYLFRRRGRRSS